MYLQSPHDTNKHIQPENISYILPFTKWEISFLLCYSTTETLLQKLIIYIRSFFE